ncbi:DNA-directed DNA polymerase [Macleaya cordata]|uniref:DNA-directed DNA polymerase n=1 Tax=Macleaya cordata TaxID=56857 RepID=A0A200PP11_MACCD|nr:DNA-directed DNA polymerase [Macleaya cordata]
MASGSPRTRIDQFYASRKKKPISPGLKSERKEKDSIVALGGSPGAKGSLENYLVKSQDDSFRDSGASLRKDQVKRKLAEDIDSSSKLVNKRENLSIQEQSQTVEGLKGKSGESLGVGDITSRAPVEDTIGSAPAVENPELKQFAAHFLSLYCSELSSTVTPSSELKLNVNKRSGSPSLLDAEDKKGKKKQCIPNNDQSQPEGGIASPIQEYHELVKSGFSAKTGEVSFSRSGELDGTGDNSPAEPHASLRKCSKSTKPSIAKVDLCTPDILRNKARETPKSVQGSSIFSPGEAFWNEAIQVADGMFVPIDKLSVQAAQELNVLKGKSEQKNSCDLRIRRSGDLLSEGFTEGESIARHLVSSTTFELHDKKNIENSVLVSDKEVSPMPVKHFDFLQEDKNLDESTPHQFYIDNPKDNYLKGSGQSDTGSVNCKGLRTTSTLTRCRIAQTNRWDPSEGKVGSSFLMSSNMNPDFPTSDSGEKHQALQMDSVSVAAEGKEVLQNQENRSDRSGAQVEDIRSPLIADHKYYESGTPSSSLPVKDYLELSSWLPSELCSIYMKKGISKLYPWQVDCLKVDGVLQKRNLVYCASTSAGKSFVAEILMLRRVITTGKIALLVLPYVSICAEKAEHLEVLLEPLGKHVRSFYGNQGGGTLPKDTSVAVCTIEKANFLINRLLEEGRLSEIGIIVIDELHMVGDQHRGYLLELMLTKLRYAAGEGNVESSSGESSGSSSGKADPAHGLQIVGMSATMPNVAAVADWLQAALYQTEFRPVPLEEYIKVGNTIYDKKMDLIRTIPKAADLGGKDPDHILELCNEVVQEGHSVLLFCSSRKGCESTARHVAKFLKKFPINTHDDRSELSDISSAIDALRRCPVGLDPILEETLPSGVAYHHAGLTVEEREIVETCYRKGLVRVLTATSTLAAGVNLPARRVIFRQPRIGRDFIDGTRYRQMSGRAGRTGIDTKGESVLICKPEEVKRITAVLNDSCPPLQSCLSEDKNGMTHAILEVVAGGIVQTANDINRYVRCTLLNSTKPFQDVVKSAQDSLRWLCHRKFLEWNEETKLYSTTPLGRASFGSSLSPEESLVVLDDLSRAREGFVLASDLHLVYLVTPINVDVEPDWELFYERFMQLSALEQSVGNRVGVGEPFLMRMAHGAPISVKSRENKKGLQGKSQNRTVVSNNNMLSDEHTLRVCRRFYVALILSRLVQEAPVGDVCEAYKVARGMVQALQENAGRFASMVSLFCERLGWHDLESLVAKFQNRISFGVRAEIVELTNIPYVKGSRARALYKAGLRTPQAIAEASVPEIVKALFESSSWAAQEGSAQRRIQLGVAKKIKNGARKIVLDKAEEARLAAFSAFKSLGLLVPQFSQPLLPNFAGNPIIEGAMASSGEDTNCSLVGIEPMKNSADKLAGEEGNDVSDTAALQIEREKSTKISDIVLGTSEEVNSNVALQCIPGAGNLGVPIEGSVLKSRDKVGSGTQTENSVIPISTQFVDASENNRIVGGHVDHEQKEGSSRGGIVCQKGNEKLYEKGPINASKMTGGFDSFLDLWDTIREFYFDVHFTKRSELNSIVPFEIHGMAVCWEGSPVYYVNLSKDLTCSGKFGCNIKPEDPSRSVIGDMNGVLPPNQQWEIAKQRWNKIGKIMVRSSIKKIGWNLKVQIQVLKKPGICIHRFGSLSFAQKDMDIQLVDNSFFLLPPIYVQDVIDMCIVAWILWPDEERSSNPNLEKEVKKRLSSEAAAAAHRDGRWKNQMRRAAHNGCCRRVAQTRALGTVLWKLVVSEELVEALVSIENPLVNILADMELWGIGVDMEGCLRARQMLGKKLKELETEAYRLAGKTFSLFTAADIANILYGHLKLPIPEGQSKGKQHPSTDKHSLDLLRHQHPIVSVIKEHRTLAKLLNCTLGSICSLARLSMRSQKYTLHGHWLQTSTATGRLSMEEPNLQCVEHEVEFKASLKDKNGSDLDADRHVINARDFFMPTQDNWLLLTADYSQIELRLMAHFSKDSSLIQFLSKPNGDVFTMIAARWTGQLEAAVSSQERDQTKRLVYGILYGMGPKTLAEQLDCSSDEAAEKIQSFKSSFPGVASWLHEAVESCRQKGYITTLKGRKRFLSKIKLGNSKEKGKAQRQAVNSICQGSAADIIKIAMITIHSVIAEGCLIPDSASNFAAQFPMLKGHCRLVLQVVHDELVLEVDPSVLREAGLLLHGSMESAVSLLVPLHAKLKVGRTWGSLEPFRAS